MRTQKADAKLQVCVIKGCGNLQPELASQVIHPTGATLSDFSTDDKSLTSRGRFLGSKILMTEVPHAGKDHGEAGLIGCLDDLFIAE